MSFSKLLFLLLITGLQASFYAKAQMKNVHFIIEDLAGNSKEKFGIFLAGNMNNWKPADTNYRFRNLHKSQFDLIVKLPDGVNEYKITRGTWDKVECRIDGQPAANRTMFLTRDTVIFLTVNQWQDNFKKLVKVHTASKNVHVIDSNFNIPQLDRKRRIWVYLPPDYETSTKSYPVIYMHDGQNLFDSYTAGYGEWGVDEMMDSLYLKNHSMAIIVGVDHGGEHRLTEYNPFSNEGFGKGRGSDYVDFLARTLKPYIDQNFRTKASLKNTSIAGSSMGGLISLYTVAKYPKVFGKAGVFSPALWIAPEIFDYLAGNKGRGNKIYFVAGDLESNQMVPDMKKIFDQLVLHGKKKRHVFYKASPDGKHSEWFWHREFPQFYEWIMN